MKAYPIIVDYLKGHVTTNSTWILRQKSGLKTMDNTETNGKWSTICIRHSQQSQSHNLHTFNMIIITMIIPIRILFGDMPMSAYSLWCIGIGFVNKLHVEITSFMTKSQQ